NPVPSAPDLILGQKDLAGRTANDDPDTHTISARTVALSSGSVVFAAQLMFDPAGNLFVADGGNHRLLRFPAGLIGTGASHAPAADLVLGQANFTISPPQSPAAVTDLSRLYVPSGMAMDAAGRLYVCDTGHRVLVYGVPQVNGGAAARLIGGTLNLQGGAPQPPDARSLNAPEAVFVIGDIPYVVDTGNHRILRFKRYEEWPADIATPPQADDVIGQPLFSDYGPNRGSPWPVSGTVGNPSVSFFSPAFAVRAAGELFVADRLNHRVVALTDPATTLGVGMATKRVLGQQLLDTNGLNLLEGREFLFNSTGGVVVDTRSSPPHLYVADTGNNRVLGFRDARIARPGDKADLVIGQADFLRYYINYPAHKSDQPTRQSLYLPGGLAVDAAGNLFVADTGNGRVLRFPSPFEHGNFPEADLVLGKPGYTTPLDPAADPSMIHLNSPYGVALTTGGHLVVSDLGFNRVLVFRKPDGGDFTSGMQATAVIGQPDFLSKAAGSENKQMRNPRHISIDTSDRLFVCDTGNNRIQAYDSVSWASADPSPAVLLTRADPVGTLNAPQGIYVSPITGEIWVANTGSPYVLRYPRFETLAVSPVPDFLMPSAAIVERPLALTVDGFGNLLVAYSTNRIGFYFPAAAPINAASYRTRLAPGMLTALYAMGGQFVNQTVSAPSLPLPTELADIQVLVDDKAAPLLWVSPGQINFIMPMVPKISGSVEVQVVRKSLGQVLAVGCPAARIAADRFICSGGLQMDIASPALFAGTNYSTAAGQIAAMNVRASDGTYYGINSSANPVARSDYVEIYGTGQGYIENAPPDGAAPGSSPLHSTSGKPQVIVNVATVPDDFVTFSGLNPAFPGLWQLKVKIPDSTPPSNTIQVVVVHRSIPSNDVGWTSSKILTVIAVKQ
ncbi:MAG: hypothetical protein EHM65_02590, partial [Acidobacteriales bacterium]